MAPFISTSTILACLWQGRKIISRDNTHGKLLTRYWRIQYRAIFQTKDNMRKITIIIFYFFHITLPLMNHSVSWVPIGTLKFKQHWFHSVLGRMMSFSLWAERSRMWYTEKKIYRLHLERIVKHVLNPLTRNIVLQVIRIR